MKKINFLILLLVFCGGMAFGQTAYNPFTQNIHFAPEPTAQGFECGSVQTVVFTQGLTTSADATQWASNPLIVSICLQGFDFNGPASSVVSGTYAGNFNWAYSTTNPNCLIGTQNQTLPGTGSNPAFPNPLSSGSINVSLKVPVGSPVGTILKVDVSLIVPTYMSFFNSIPDDDESTQTQTFCGCYALTDAGVVAADQSFCVSGDPALFTSTTAASGGSGGVILYQWQKLVGSTWTDIVGATNATYDAPAVSTTTQYRRNAKRSLCGGWLNSNVLTVTINSLPTVDAGSDLNLNCTTTSGTIGTAAIAGNTYLWSPSAGLSNGNIAQPNASPNATTTYTLTVTNSNGCSATDVVVVNVNTTPPTVDAGTDKFLTCSLTSAVIGTAAIPGNTYSWSPAAGLNNTNIAQPTANPSVTTSYTVTVTGTNGCTATDVVVVNVNTAPPVADAGADKLVNCTITSVSIGTAAIAGNSYSWSPATGLSNASIAQPTANPAATTTYTLTVTGANGCTATDVVIVNVNTTPPLADAGLDKNLNCTVTSSLIGTPAIGGNTYVWSPGTGLNATNIAQPVASPLATTTYTVLVIGTNGCTSTDVVIVNVNTAPPVVDAGVDKFLTCTTTSTTIGTTAIPGNTYSWSPATGLSNTLIAQPVANPSVTTSYTVTVTGSNGCTATDVVVVDVNTVPPTTDAGADKFLNCSSTSATIGTAAIAGNSYSWSPSTGLSATNIAQPVASPTATTTYTLTVTGANGCTQTDVVVVNVNTTIPTADAGPNKLLTCLVNSAQIGTAAIAGNTYSWSPATGLSATNIAQPIASVTSTTVYTVTVTGTNGCTATSTVTVNVDTSFPTVDAGSDKLLNCTVTSATIGTAAIPGNTYSWSPATGLSNTLIAQPVANPSVTTTYTVTVTGTNGCTASDVVVVNVDTAPPVTDAGADKFLTCSVTSAVIGTTAIAGNTYSWSPATGLSNTLIAQPTASPTSTTTYSLTVTGSNGCTQTDVVVVNVNTTPPAADAGADKFLTCSNTSATIGTAAIAGNTYSWSPAAGLSATNIAQPVASPSSTTTYTVVVTGTNGCTATDVVVVNVNTAPPVADAGPTKNLTCTTTSATIGTAAIAGNSYSWSPATGLSATNIAQPTANPTSTTVYTVTVTGANGCTATSTVTVNVNTTPPVTDAGADKFLTCAVTSATIGTPAVAGNTYAWSPATGLSATNIAEPTASPSTTTSYTVVVTGTNGCTATDVVVVNVNTTAPVADAGPNKVLNCSVTFATIGTAAIAGNSYLWSPAIGLNATNIAQPVASPATTTTYTVVVTGINGCTATSTVVVNVSTAPPVADAGPTRNLNCNTTFASIGTAAISGNTYSWSPATGLSATNIAQPIANPSSTTVYTVTVTGANGCTATSTVTVNVNTTPPATDAGADKFLTCAVTSAIIGTPAVAGNSYAWSPSLGLSASNIAQPIASPSSTTTYTLTVTGANGCTATDVVVVNVNTTPPGADAGPDRLLDCSVTSATIGTAAVAGNSYSWSPSTGLNSASVAQPVASPTSTQTYTVTVTGANGCTSTDEVVVTVNSAPPAVDAGIDKSLNCLVTSTTIGTPFIAGNTYSWSPSTGLSSASVAQPTANPASTTVYTLTVTGPNGCTATDVVVVNVNTTPPVTDAGPDKSLNCSITSTTIGTAAVAGNTYVWSPSTGLNSATIAQPTASPSATTSYTLTVTGSNGCTATDVVVVNVNTTTPTADAGPDKFLTCATTSAIIGTTAIAGNNYVWSPNIALNSNTIAQPIASPLVTTVYTVTVTGANGCTASDVVVVNVNNTVPTITITGIPEVCNGSLAAMTATTNIGSIMWSNGSTLATQNLSAGTYTVTANNGGCISTATVTVITREGTVGNFVWNDANADGINNEPISAGINGVTVQLWTVGLDLIQGTTDDQLYASTVTANNLIGNPGYYNFIVCTDGNYYVKFPLSTNSDDTLTVQTATPFADNNSDPNRITGNSPVFSIQTNGSGLLKDNNTIDAGYVLTLSMGNLVWNDLNKNGVKDPAEPGLQGCAVRLYNDVNNDGVPDGAAIQNTTTNASGLYVFNELLPGNYLVGVIPPTPGSGNAFVSSVTGQELNPNLDVDNNDNGIVTIGSETLSGTVTLLGGTEPTGETPNNGTSPDNSSNLTIDFGFYQPVSIYGNVFNDITGPTNVDGIGTGSASGSQLYANLLNSSGIVVAVVPVNANGTYLFADVLSNNTYSVLLSTTQGTVGNTAPAAVLPTGWEYVAEDCCDNVGNDGFTNGITTVVVGIQDVFNVNFGIRQPMSVGNSVFLDANKNGFKDASETGIANAVIKLYVDANNDGVPDGPSIATTTSDANGNYVFNGLNSGNYLIGVTPPSVAGGYYTSSTTGQELNPNLDVDNNDNGIVTSGGETLCGTITLVPGTEPTGELPNNGLAPDGNANLTVDFGFFICPNNFTFNPVYICPGSTLNLTTLEPADYSGGVWTDNIGTPLSNTNVINGTYHYTYTNGGCTATGSVQLELNIPDYTPTISIAPSAITGTTNVRVIITVEELLNRTPCSDIYVLVPKLEPRFTFSWNASATSMGGVPVSNPDWQYFNTNPNFYVWKYVGATAFPGGGQSKFGFIGPYDPNQTDGATTYSVQVYQGSGGENIITNNTDSEVLIYFR